MSAIRRFFNRVFRYYWPNSDNFVVHKDISGLTRLFQSNSPLCRETCRDFFSIGASFASYLIPRFVHFTFSDFKILNFSHGAELYFPTNTSVNSFFKRLNPLRVPVNAIFSLRANQR